MEALHLKAPPGSALLRDESPFGLAVRRLLGEGDARFDRLAAQRLARLYRGQLASGSWQGSVLTTIQALGELALLDGDRVRARRAVDWLLEKDRPALRCTSSDGAPYDGLFFETPRRADGAQIYRGFDSLFNRGCFGFVKTGAALFFAGLFGTTVPGRVEAAFASLDQALDRRRGRWCSLYCSNNILRAYVGHPLRRDSTATNRALAYLEKIQSAGGAWPGTPFFYHTFHTVASHSSPSARRQVDRALGRIARSQNPDGTWGRRAPALATFLVLDGLRRQGVKLA